MNINIQSKNRVLLILKSMSLSVVNSHMVYAIIAAGGTYLIDTNDQEVSHKDDHGAYKATLKSREGLDLRMDGHIQRRLLIRDAASAFIPARAVGRGPRIGEVGEASVRFLGAPVVIVQEGCDDAEVCVFALLT